MGDFDLSQALEGSSELEETGTESRCFDMKDVEDGIFTLDEGLNLVVSHNPKTMQCVVSLVMAVNRMKKSLTRCRELSDEQLCCAIMGGLVDEKLVKTEVNSTTGAMKRTFTRVNSVRQCTLCDSSQKDLCHTSGELKLQAITLTGGNCERRVKFELSRYVAPAATSQTVVLSITNSNLHMSCSMKDGKAVLSLEECCEKDLQKISDDGDMDRFLFNRRTTGATQTTFESVKCSSWFISTSSEDEFQPVEMCQVDTAHRLTVFKIK